MARRPPITIVHEALSRHDTATCQQLARELEATYACIWARLRVLQEHGCATATYEGALVQWRAVPAEHAWLGSRGSIVRGDLMPPIDAYPDETFVSGLVPTSDIWSEK